MRGKFIAYYRVSTDKQGKSGLGLAAQRKAVRDYLDGGKWELLGEFTEVETGNCNPRPELEKAIAACKKHRARLIIAKLDRLSRNVAFIATLMKRKVDFVCVDNPTATKFTIHILAAVVEAARDMIATRMREAFAAARRAGKRIAIPTLAATTARPRSGVRNVSAPTSLRRRTCRRRPLPTSSTAAALRLRTASAVARDAGISSSAAPLAFEAEVARGVFAAGLMIASAEPGHPRRTQSTEA